MQQSDIERKQKCRYLDFKKKANHLGIYLNPTDLTIIRRAYSIEKMVNKDHHDDGQIWINYENVLKNLVPLVRKSVNNPSKFMISWTMSNSAKMTSHMRVKSGHISDPSHLDVID